MFLLNKKSTDNFLSPIFSLFVSKIWSMLHQGSIGRVQSKERYFIFMFHFFDIFVVFHQFFLFFCYYFLFFFFFIFWLLQQNTNLSETGIDHKKLSVELFAHECHFWLCCHDYNILEVVTILLVFVFRKTERDCY